MEWAIRYIHTWIYLAHSLHFIDSQLTSTKVCLSHQDANSRELDKVGLADKSQADFPTLYSQ